MKDLPINYKEKTYFLKEIFQIYNNNQLNKNPIVFILNSSIYSEKQMNFIFGNEFILKNCIKIKFSVYGVKAINTVLNVIAIKEDRMKNINSNILKEKIEEIKITSNGDLRNAINNFFLFFLKNFNLNKNDYYNSKIKTKSKKHDKDVEKAKIKSNSELL